MSFVFLQIICILSQINFSQSQDNTQQEKLSDSHSHNFVLEAQHYFQKNKKEEYDIIEILQLFLKLYGETNLESIKNTMKKIHLNQDISDTEKHDIFLAETIEDFLREVKIDDEKKLLNRKVIMDIIKDNSFFHYLEQKEEKEQKPDLELLKEMIEEDEKYEELLNELEDEEIDEDLQKQLTQINLQKGSFNLINLPKILQKLLNKTSQRCKNRFLLFNSNKIYIFQKY